MILMDTNVLLHAVNRDSPDHKTMLGVVEAYAGGIEPWAVSWGILYEYLRVATHPKVFPKPLTVDHAYGFVRDVLKSADAAIISETDFHETVFETSLKEVHRLSGNLIHDFHIAVLMREHGLKEILTLDSDFRAFPWIRIREPRSV